MKPSYKTTLVGILSVAIAFVVAIPLGFQLREHYPAWSDNAIAAVVVTALLVVPVGLMRILNGPLMPSQKTELVSRTGYEMTIQSDPAKQYAIYQEAMNAWR